MGEICRNMARKYISIRGKKVSITKEEGYIVARDVKGDILQASDGTFFRQKASEEVTKETIRLAIQRDKIQNQAKNKLQSVVSGRTTKVYDSRRWSEYETDRVNDKNLPGFIRGRFRVIIARGKQVYAGDVMVNSRVTVQQAFYTKRLNEYLSTGKDGRKDNVEFIKKMFDGAVSEFLKSRRLEKRFGSSDVGIVALQDFTLRYRILKARSQVRESNVSILTKQEVKTRQPIRD